MALKLRRGTDSGRSAITPAEGEPIFTTDTKKLYVGDGSTAGGIAVDTAVSDGDKGDITVSSSGATWTIDNDAVTYAKIQNVSATSRLLGRASSGAGDVEEITIGSGLTLTGTTLSASGGGGGGTGAPTYVVTKTADETITSSTTLQDDDHLFQALTSGKSYWIELKLLLTRTDTVNSVNGNYVIDGNSEGYMAGTNLMNNSTTISFGGLGGVGVAGLPLRKYDQGTLKLTTNYTLKFRWAQAASSTTGVTVMKGSQLLIWEF